MALRDYPETVRQILIVDCDVHQGNGNAALFRSRPAVFTFSMHCKANFFSEKEVGALQPPRYSRTCGVNFGCVVSRRLRKRDSVLLYYVLWPVVRHGFKVEKRAAAALCTPSWADILSKPLIQRRAACLPPEHEDGSRTIT